MTADHSKTNLLGLAQGELEQWFVSIGEKPFRARQLMQWIYQRGTTEFAAMTDLSKALRARLEDVATVDLPPVQSEHRSADGTIPDVLTVTRRRDRPKAQSDNRIRSAGRTAR